uniref:Melanocortin 2 receptor accessory protein n=2 Tax=Oreochromis TaxID=8139 RepID=A0A669BC90_ORENI
DDGIIYEYYYDYLDPVIVDERTLKYYKYSVVIIFWVVVITFVVCLFLTLNLLLKVAFNAFKVRFIAETCMYVSVCFNMRNP